MFQRVQVPSSGTVGAPRHTELWTLLSSGAFSVTEAFGY